MTMGLNFEVKQYIEKCFEVKRWLKVMEEKFSNVIDAFKEDLATVRHHIVEYEKFKLELNSTSDACKYRML